jgi:hypothetical protein
MQRKAILLKRRLSACKWGARKQRSFPYESKETLSEAHRCRDYGSIEYLPSSIMQFRWTQALEDTKHRKGDPVGDLLHGVVFKQQRLCGCGVGER